MQCSQNVDYGKSEWNIFSFTLYCLPLASMPTSFIMSGKQFIWTLFYNEKYFSILKTELYNFGFLIQICWEKQQNSPVFVKFLLQIKQRRFFPISPPFLYPREDGMRSRFRAIRQTKRDGVIQVPGTGRTRLIARCTVWKRQFLQYCRFTFVSNRFYWPSLLLLRPCGKLFA